MSQTRVHEQEPLVIRSALPWRWLGLGLAALLLIAAVAWVWTQRFPGEGSAEVTFARAMTAHHEQAVAMALALYDRTEDEELRQLVLDILLTQQAQIGQMQGWLAVWRRPLHGLEPPMGEQAQMMGMASQADVNALATLPTEAAEVSFLQLMIRHHQGGVLMAEEALVETDHPAVERLAQAILSAQQIEIEYMTELLAQRDAEPLSPLPGHEH